MQPPQPDPLIELKRMEIMGRIKAEQARIQVEWIRAQAEIARVAQQARTASSEEAKNESVAILNLAKAEAAELGSQLNTYKAQLEALEADAADQQGLTEDVIARTLTGNTGAQGGPTGTG
jgi:propanediol dehydratase small subunit